MKTRWLKLLFILVCLELLITTGHFWLSKWNHAFSGAIVHYNTDLNVHTVHERTPETWPGIAPDRFQIKDQILQINGLDPALGLAQLRNNPPGQVYTFHILRPPDQYLSLTLPSSQYTVEQLLFTSATSVIFGLSFLIVAGLLIYSGSLSQGEGYLVLAFLLIASRSFAMEHGFTGLPARLIGVTIAYTTEPLVPAFFILMALFYPVPLARTNVFYRWRYSVVILSFLLIIWHQYAFIYQLGGLLHQAKLANAVYHFVAILFVCVRYFFVYRKHPSVRVRNIIKLYAFGVLTGIVLSQGLRWGMMFAGLWHVLFEDALYLSVLLPMSVGYATLRYKTYPFPKQQLILKLFIIVALSLLVAAVSRFLLLLGPNWDVNFLGLWAVALLACLIGAFSGSQLLQSSLIFERQAITALEDVFINLPPLKQLPAAIARTLHQNLEIHWAECRFFIKDGQKDDHHLEAVAGDKQTDPALHIPLILDGRAVGHVALGPRWTGLPFNETEQAALLRLSQPIVLAFQTAKQIQELKLLPQRIATAQEQERQHLARELHDTAEQAVARLSFALSNMTLGGEAGRTATQTARQEIRQLARDLRAIRHQLTPVDLQNGHFEEAIVKLCRNFTQQSHINCQFELAPHLNERLSVEMSYPLYRVIQQSLDNIAQHAQTADQVRVEITLQTEQLTFSISDNGCGFDPTNFEHPSTEHFGLQSMQDRLTLLNGQLKISSAPKQGTTISGTFPLSC